MRNSSHCTEITARISFISFIPQAIFFFVFIWVIFKLLKIWRMMNADTEGGKQFQRKCTVCVKTSFYVSWGAFWIAERIAGYKIIL